MIGLRSNGLTCIINCHTQEILDVPPSIGSLLTVKHSGFLKTETSILLEVSNTGSFTISLNDSIAILLDNYFDDSVDEYFPLK